MGNKKKVLVSRRRTLTPQRVVLAQPRLDIAYRSSCEFVMCKSHFSKHVLDEYYKPLHISLPTISCGVYISMKPR